MNHFKKPPIKSKKLTQAAKGQTCTLVVPGVCKGGTATTVSCHLQSDVKGFGNKSPDLLAVDACHRCHDWLDRRRFRGICEDERDTIILKAFKKTILRRYYQDIIQIK